MKVHVKKGDTIIFFVAILFSGIALWFFAHENQGEKVIITVNGEKKIYSLQEDQRIEIKEKNGHYNLIVIHSGEVSMLEADCPNQVCVKHKKISKNGEMIVCLPNEVFVQIEGGKEKEVDN